MRFSASTLLVALCLPIPAADGAPAEEPLHLECAGPFGREATIASLSGVFGSGNVVKQLINGPEASTLEVTLVFPNNPDRRLVVLWNDDAARARPSAVIIEDGSAWIGPGGIRLGSTLAEVEAINGAPFTILGFGWDYGGSAGFQKGALSEVPGGCTLSLTFQIGEGAVGAEFDAIMGDTEFRSDNPLMQKAEPVVTQITIGYPEQAAAVIRR